MDALFLILSLVVLSWVSYAIGCDVTTYKADRQLKERRARWLRYLPGDQESVARHAIIETTNPLDL